MDWYLPAQCELLWKVQHILEASLVTIEDQGPLLRNLFQISICWASWNVYHWTQSSDFNRRFRYIQSFYRHLGWIVAWTAINWFQRYWFQKCWEILRPKHISSLSKSLGWTKICLSSFEKLEPLSWTWTCFTRLFAGLFTSDKWLGFTWLPTQSGCNEAVTLSVSNHSRKHLEGKKIWWKYKQFNHLKHLHPAVSQQFRAEVVGGTDSYSDAIWAQRSSWGQICQALPPAPIAGPPQVTHCQSKHLKRSVIPDFSSCFCF